MVKPGATGSRTKKVEREETLGAWMAFALTVGLFLIGSYATSFRTWGFNTWGFLPFPWNWSPAFVAVGFAVVARLASASNRSTTPREDSDIRYWSIALVMVGLQVTLFTFLRTQTHFLGDGYQLLAQLAGEVELDRWRDFGERWLHLAVSNLMQGDRARAALGSYRIISIMSGALILVVLLAYARMQYLGTLDRLLFAGVVSVSGAMLLAYGYVENYSLLALSIVLLLVTGLLALQKRLPWWAILAPTLVLPVVHVMGAVFVPAALYAMGSSAGVRTARSEGRRRRRLWSWGIVVLLAATVLLYLVSTSRYARFALVPLRAHPFTIQQYTLFSGAHIADWLNLLILLQPAFALFVVVLSMPACRRALGRPDVRFLMVGAISALLASFVLDPKLGMPRDWDLLSFAAWPLSMLLATLLFAEQAPKRWQRTVAGLVLILGAMSLWPRALILSAPEWGTQQARSYLDLDPGRSRTGHVLLAKYYLEHGDTLGYQQIERKRQMRYPEEAVALQAQALLEQRKYQEAYNAAVKVIRLAPNVFEGWLHLGRCYQAAGLIDSAIGAFEIADGLNPDNFLLQVHLGMCYAGGGSHVKAERLLARAIKMDTTHAQPYASLAYIHRLRGDTAGYELLIGQASQRSDAEAWLFKDLGDIHAGRREWEPAVSAYRRALQLGGDSTPIKNTVEQYPELKSLMAAPDR